MKNIVFHEELRYYCFLANDKLLYLVLYSRNAVTLLVIYIKRYYSSDCFISMIPGAF